MYVMLREYIYGLDVTEFNEEGEAILYPDRKDADKSLRDYQRDVNLAFIAGDMDAPYDNDCEIAEVEFSNKQLLRNVDNGEYYSLRQT